MLFVVSIIFATPACSAEDRDKKRAGSDTSDYVAVVNGEKIPIEELNRKVDLIKQRYEGMGRPLESEQLKTLRENILNNMVEKELLYQETRKQGIEVAPAEVQNEFDKIRTKFPVPEEFQKKIKEMGYTEDILKQQIHENLAVKNLIDQEVVAQIKVTDEEVKAYYEANKTEFTIPEQVRARHILIKVGLDASDAEKEEARKKIREIQKKQENGSDFATLAKDYSEGPSSKDGGDLGFFSRGQMVEAFDNAAFSLEPGKTSDIVETRFGYHLIQVEDRNPESQKSFDEVKAMIREELQRQQVIQQLGPYIESLKQKYPVEINLSDAEKE